MPDYMFNDGAAIARPAAKPPTEDEQSPAPMEPRPEDPASADPPSSN
jgi:hypothetical protein